MASSRLVLLATLLLLSISVSARSSEEPEPEEVSAAAAAAAAATGAAVEDQAWNATIVPLSNSRYVSPARRKLGLFRECSPCKCCTDYTRRFCYYTACCYRIDCFAAGLPFGHCSFTPVTCNCFKC